MPEFPEIRTIRIAAAVILDGDRKLLLVRKRGTSAFMQPGGKIEPGELAADALARELVEELGVRVAPGGSSYLGCFSAPAANEQGATVEAELFELSIAGQPTPAAEIEEIIWLDTVSHDGFDLAPLTRDTVLPLYRR